MAFGTLLWKSVILTSVTLLLRDLAGIGSAPQIRPREAKIGTNLQVEIIPYRSGAPAMP